MKKIVVVLLCIASLASCKSKPKAPAVEKIEVKEVSSFQKDKAYDLGKRVLNTCNTSKFKPFTSEEATEKVRQNTTLERLSSTCSKYLIKYGRFEDLKLVEVIQNNDDDSVVFRFKAEYQRKHTQKELQVTLNSENKVSAIKSTDWADVYVP